MFLESLSDDLATEEDTVMLLLQGRHQSYGSFCRKPITQIVTGRSLYHVEGNFALSVSLLLAL